MKTLLYANRAEPKSISVISILLLAAVGDITKLRCMHRECYIFASQNLCRYYKTLFINIMEYKINTIYFFYYFGLCDIPLRSKIVFVFIIYIYSLQYNDSLIIF